MSELNTWPENKNLVFQLDSLTDIFYKLNKLNL